MNTDTLFITYDGLLDPLGSSQILPYLKGIAAHPRQLHILSFEKPDRHSQGASRLGTELAALGIAWTPLLFTARAGKLGKLWDLARMYLTAIRLQKKHRFSIIHCRSYQAMQVGCLLKRLTGAKILFDMRGLWVDDRVEGGLWKQDRLLNRLLYRYYKRAERSMLVAANHVVVLTRRVLPEIKNIAPESIAPISIIPCCADFDHFSIQSAAVRLERRMQIGIPADAVVLSYLGSLGTVYLLEDMLLLFRAVTDVHENVHMLLITHDWRPEHERLLATMGLGVMRDRIHVQSASRADVPAFLGTSDVMVSFRRSTYSQMACSPTKLAEAFALGIPVISNFGVGDVDEITGHLEAGVVVDLENPSAFRKVAENFKSICTRGGTELRSRARVRFGLEVASEAYRKVYEDLERAE